MCATEEYAINFFISSCTRAINEVTMIAIILRVNIIGMNISEASGKKPRENLINPYPAIFNNTPAKITDPAVGASTCASGNQVWNGHIGIFTTKDAKNANHRIICSFFEN